MKFEINKNLISLKCVLFLFFGALGSLFPFLPVHMTKLGLSKDEFTTISIVSPLIALLGPLIAAPLADRLAGGFGGSPRSKTGRYLRVMIAVCLALATIFYWLLITIPPIHRSPPNVTFMCDEDGGFILQDRCGMDKTCYNWNGQKGPVQVKNCIFSCNATTLYYHETSTASPNTQDNNESSTDDYYDETNETVVYNEAEIGVTTEATSNNNTNPGIFLSPHMCYKDSEGITTCEVYTEYSRVVEFNIGLKPTVTSEDNENQDETCRYPLDDYFHCRISQETIKDLRAAENPDCHPIVLCEIHEPYKNTSSLLKKSECGYNNISFWLYLVVRSIADIFPAAAVTLLSTAVVIATRETSTGRGDVGKQLAAGALGFAIFAPIIGGCADGAFRDAMICFTVLSIIAILILLFDDKMPLSPPEWWWHTRCGLLALPMSSVRKYGFEIAAVGIVLFLLGVFWNAIDTFFPWYVANLLGGTHLIVGLTLTMGALPAVTLFTFAEKVVDYCSHANILLLCFVSYIVHHIALTRISEPSFLLIFEVLEIFTLHLMWITAILYLRHLVPRKFTACGQALPVVAHFCLGRCFGALIGSLAYTYTENFGKVSGTRFAQVHAYFALAAAIIAALYFLTYHFYLKPNYVAQPQLPPYPAPSVVQSMNGNGSYTPLRVYHNGRAKKGHFRY